MSSRWRAPGPATYVRRRCRTTTRSCGSGCRRTSSPPDYALRRRFCAGGVAAGDRALDLGCGDGRLHRRPRRRRRAGDRRRRRARPRWRRARAPPPRARASGSCRSTARSRSTTAPSTLVWSSEVIEHVADTARWLSEVRRVLAPRGRLLLTHAQPRAAARWRSAGSSASPSRSATICTCTRDARCASCWPTSASTQSQVRAVGGPAAAAAAAAGPGGRADRARPARHHLRAPGAALGHRRLPRPAARGARAALDDVEVDAAANRRRRRRPAAAGQRRATRSDDRGGRGSSSRAGPAPPAPT